MTTKHAHVTSGSAIAGAGVVTAGVGLAAGGVPGSRPNGNAIFRVKRGQGNGLHRVASEVRGKAPAASAAHGGILGFRSSIHQLGSKHFEEQNRKNELARRTRETKSQSFYRGYNAGKIGPEGKIIRGMNKGRLVAHGALAVGAGATAYGIYRAKHKVDKRDRSNSYNGALVGAGTAGAVVAHGGSKYLGSQQKKYAAKASEHVDEAGRAIPALAGRHGQQMTLSQMGRHQRKHPGAPFPKTMHPVVRDGDIKRNPRLLNGASTETVERVGHLRGAAAQERHFADVFGNTSKVVRRFRTPSAIVAAVGAGGLMAHHKSVEKYLTDAQIRHRKKIASRIGYTGAAIGLTTLGAKGAQMGLKATKRPGALKAAESIGRHTEGALIAGSGVGAAGTINYAGINHAESQRGRQKKVTIPKRASLIYPVGMNQMNPMPKDPMAPSAKKTLKGTLSAINQGVVPEMPALTPGSRQLKRLSSTIGQKQVSKGLGRGLKTGWKAADFTRPAPARGYVHRPKPKTTPRTGPKATEVAGMKTGAAAHDFSEGYSRRVHPRADLESGKITTHENAVYPGAYRAGHLTRRYVTPAVVIGGGYGVGRHIGRKRQEKKLGVSKMTDNMGQLIPLSRDLVKTYGYDPEYNRHGRSGVYAGAATAGGVTALAGAAHQGYKASQNIHTNRAPAKIKGKANPKVGRLNSVRVERAGLKHAGKAGVLLAAGAGGLVAANKIRHRTSRGGSWNSYDQNYA